MSNLEENIKKVYTAYRKSAEKLNNNSFDLIFQITDACNLRCKYCYEENKQHSILSLKTMKQLVDKLFLEDDASKKWWNGRYEKNKVDRICIHFFGGECTLESLLMDSIVEYFIKKCREENSERTHLWEKNLLVIVETNATLLQESACAAFFDKWIKQNVAVHISFSLDGVREAHDLERRTADGKPTFDIVYNNITAFMEKYPVINYPNLKIFIKSTLSKKALPYYYDSYLLLKKINNKLGMPVNLQPATGLTTWDSSDVVIFREQLSKIVDDIINSDEPSSGVLTINDNYVNEIFHYPTDKICGHCGTVKNSQIVLSIDNNLYSCIQCSPVTQNNSSCAIGNITDGITDNGLEIIEKIRSSYDKTAVINENCIHCTLRYKCMGLCPAFNLKTSGDMNTKRINDYECAIWREIECARNKILYFKEKQKWIMGII